MKFNSIAIIPCLVQLSVLRYTSYTSVVCASCSVIAEVCEPLSFLESSKEENSFQISQFLGYIFC